MATSDQSAYEEVLRLILQTSGQEGVDQLRGALENLGDVDQVTAEKTGKLVNALTELNEQANAADRYSEMVDELGRLEQAFDQNQQAAYQLALRLGAMDTPSKELLATQKQLASQGETLGKALAKQWGAVAEADSKLSSMGVNTAQLTSEQQRLRSAVGQASAELVTEAGLVQKQAEAMRALNQRMEDGEEAFRKQAETSRAAAAALAAYRQRAADAERESRQLADTGNIVSNSMSRLRGLLAGVTGVLSLSALTGAVKSMLSLGDAADVTRTRLERLYGAGNGQAAFDKIRVLARDAGQQFDEMLQAALTLKSFGLEPLDGTLKGLIDENAMLGGSMENLNGLILGVGQAWAKQKLQGEEILQLVERGVPVWDLLAKATGKNVTELQRLSSAGQLGRDTIRAMLQEMAKAADGAAADGVNALSRLWTSLIDRIQSFGRSVADSGALTYFKQQVAEIGATIDRMVADGTLQQYAQRVSAAIVKIASSIKSTTQFLIAHTDALVVLAKGYAALKLATWAVQLNNVRIRWTELAKAAVAAGGAFDQTATKAARVKGALSAIPTNIRIAILMAGLDLAIEGAKKLAEVLAANSDAAKDLAAIQKASAEQMRKDALARAEQAAAYAQYREQVVLTAEQVSKLGSSERAAYEERLSGLQQYLSAQYGYLLRQKELGLATQDQLNQLAQLPARLKAVRDGFGAVAAGVKLAADALKTSISPAAQAIVQQLQGIDKDSKSAAASIKKLFDGLNYADANKLGDVALALAQIASASAGADQNVRNGLLATLEQMTGDQLLRFQGAAQAAFDTFDTAPAQAAAVLDSTLYAALERLGVSADRMGTRFTTAGKDAVAAFGAIAENANATSAQVEAAFNAALGKVSTLDDARALGAVLEAAGQQGKIGFDAAERSAAQLEARIRGITAAMDPLQDQFSVLGIKSQASLNAARDSAKAAFEAIRQGASEGKASVEDVRRALEAYGRTAKAAVADSDASAKERVDSELQVLDAIYRVNDGFKAMGQQGSEAGSTVAAGADQASQSLDRVADSASSAATATSRIGEAANGAAADMNAASSAASGFSLSLGEVSAAWTEQFHQYRQGDLAPLKYFANLTKALSEQRKELQGAIADQQKLLKGYDEDEARRAELRSKYNYLGDSELDQLISAEKQVKSAQDARIQKEQAAAEQQRQADQKRIEAAEALKAAQSAMAATTAATASTSTGEQKLVVEIQPSGKSAASGYTSADYENAKRLAVLIAPEVTRLLRQSQAVSNIRTRR